MNGPQTWRLVRDLQPDAVIFSDAGPDIRWVGNEKGRHETCWATLEPRRLCSWARRRVATESR